MTGFAVIDVETTGLYNSDRIVEVGVVLLDEQLRVEHEWGTLLNPHRHLSASEVHGLTASDVADAPDFAHVAAHLAALLDRRVVVAHNATFDLRMLAHALAHANMSAPGQLVVVDTLRLSREALGGPASLPVIAEYLSIDAPAAHEALADAQVTGQVLARLLEQSDGLVTSGAAVRAFGPESVAAMEVLDACLADALLEHAEYVAWPEATWLDAPPTHTRAHATVAASERDGYLARLVADLPANSGLASADLDGYLMALELALLDRLLTREEAESLAEVARQDGLTPDRVRAAHLSFIGGLARAAWADQRVTPAERADLEHVAHLLGLGTADIDAALEQAKVPGAAVDRKVSALAFAPGDRVVFTGEASMPRQVLSSKASAVGLVETSAVSKKTAAVVMADPLSESTKARRARELGIPIISEAVFLAMLDDLALQDA